jgi:glycosidase
MYRQLSLGIREVWRGAAPVSTGSYTIEVDASDTTAVFGPYAVPAEPFAAVEWAGDAVAYQIFPERFWNGDPTNDSAALATDEYNYMDAAFRGAPPSVSGWSDPPTDAHCCHQYFGGDLQGIIDKLDYLDGLGVDVVYMNPIFMAGSAHGYDTYDYRRVAPHFGDSTTVRALVDAAHARGIRLIWDFVPNHVGVGHWAFQDAVANGESSDYWDWFEFHVPVDSIHVGNAADYEAWWGFGSLPELHTENPDVLDHLLDIARGWTEFGFDGIRVDVPGDIDNRGTFFPAFRDAVKGVDPETYLVGEIWERDESWLQGDQFDALMNYAIGQGVIQRFALGDISGVVAAREMAELYAAYPEAATAMLFNLIASHDTERLLTMMGGGELGASPSADALARQRLASAFLFAIPGMPVTFQGDECALLGGHDDKHLARYPVQWDQCDPVMADHYATLASLKHDLPALASPVIREYDAGSTTLAFYRGEPGSGEVLAVFNNGVAPSAVLLPAGSWTDVVSGDTMTDSADLDGYGWRYLVRADP